MARVYSSGVTLDEEYRRIAECLRELISASEYTERAEVLSLFFTWAGYGCGPASEIGAFSSADLAIKLAVDLRSRFGVDEEVSWSVMTTTSRILISFAPPEAELLSLEDLFLTLDHVALTAWLDELSQWIAHQSR